MGPARRNAQGAGEPSRRGIRADQNLEEALEKHLESIRVVQHAATPGRARGRRIASRIPPGRVSDCWRPFAVGGGVPQASAREGEWRALKAEAEL